MPIPSPPRQLAELLDRAAIADVVKSYAHSIDRRDWDWYLSLFAAQIDVDFSTWAGIRRRIGAQEWVAMVRQTLACFDSTQHTLTNLLISVDGDTARCIANMTARHELITEGRAEVQTLGGYYTDRLVRTAAGWKIDGCALMITWEEGERGLFERAAARGARARIDVGMQGA